MKQLCTWLMVASLLLAPTALYAQGSAPVIDDNTVFLPLVVQESGEVTQSLPNRFIVVFKADQVAAASLSATAEAFAATYGGNVLHTYDSALSGFALALPEENTLAAIAALDDDPRVEFVEEDQLISLGPVEVSDLGEDAAGEEAANAAEVETTQTNPVWGLDRTDQRFLPLDARYTYATTGAGVRVYIIDTGIRITHNEFGGRAFYGFDAVDGSLPANDCNGHGTHVAGTVGGRRYGVAKSVRLVAVRVLGCNGSGFISDVIAGVNWVTQQRRNNPGFPHVANMSLGASARIASLDQAVRSSVTAGVTYALSAGNSNTNACNQSPAAVTSALTVGATDRLDVRASFSNYGSCLDLFAPGVGVRSAWYTSNTATATLNGTSMAAPHVAGAAARYLQTHTSASPSAVANAIRNAATTGVVINRGPNSPNRLLYASPTQ